MLISTCKIFKDKNRHKLVVRAICNLNQICRCLLHQIARKTMSWLVNNLYGKKITKARQTKFCMLFVIFICYNFAHVLHENALVFSQSEVRNFLMYITFSFNPVHFLSKRLEYTNEPCFRRWSNFFKATISQLKVAFCKIKLGVSWACTTDQGLSFKHLIVAIVDA